MYERKILELDLNDILPNRFQPRLKFDETSIMDLAESIKEHGVIQPIVVRRLGDRYEIIAGERRYKASVIAGKTTIPAIVAEVSDKDSAEIALIENVQRQDLTPIEEAISYKKILDMGYLTQEELAEKLGKTQSTIANKIRLLNLDEEVQAALLDTKISERHARSLLKLSNKKQQITMLNKIIKERLTVRKTDEEIAKMINENNNNVEILDFNEQPNPTPLEQNNYNIPGSPIIEDVIEPQISTEAINPGFMNVEKIEKEAQDIIPQERPVADMNDLLKNPMEENIVTLNPEPQPVMSTDDTLLKPGKFFNILEESEMEKTKSPEVAIPTPTMENFQFDNSVTQPTQNEFIAREPNQQEATISNDFLFDMPEGKPTPIIPVQPEPLVQYPENSTLPASEPTPTLTIPDYQFNGDSNTQLEATLEQSKIQQKNIKEAIDAIRECAEKLTKLGFVVDMEEYDFEDMYQAIFKVNK